MTSKKNEIIATVSRAKIELEQALEDLKCLPIHDPLVIGFITRALSSYLNINRATLSLLTRALQKQSDVQVLAWLEGLQSAATRMEYLIDQMKGVPSEAPPALTFRKVDVPLLVRRACEFYRRTAARKDIRVLFECASMTTRLVWTDRVAVAAIMDNLLSNAVKFSPPGKAVRVEVRYRDNSIVCSVKDEGPGIRAAARARLFRKEGRVPTHPNSGKTSAGFGLVVASDLVAMLGGEIWCESEPGRGSCFFFRLPSSRTSIARAAASAKAK